MTSEIRDPDYKCEKLSSIDLPPRRYKTGNESPRTDAVWIACKWRTARISEPYQQPTYYIPNNNKEALAPDDRRESAFSNSNYRVFPARERAGRGVATGQSFGWRPG